MSNYIENEDQYVEQMVRAARLQRRVAEAIKEDEARERRMRINPIAVDYYPDEEQVRNLPQPIPNPHPPTDDLPITRE